MGIHKIYGHHFRSGQEGEEPRRWGIDFARASEVFANRTAEIEDTRRDYGERRFITAGPLADRIVVIVWTPRDGWRRIISMRFAHEREQALWRQLIG